MYRDARLVTSRLLSAPRLLIATALLSVTALSTHGAVAQRVGVASAVNPDATAQPPGQDVRLIRVGADMVHDERIVTSTKGRTHLLFIDGSALTIGPNSDLVLDEFVYDPGTKTGRIALNATKGLFRFVGGKISKQGGVQIKTPTALIGIRGGIGIITVTPREQTGGLPGNGLASGAEGDGPVQLAQLQPTITTARLGFGEMTVNTNGGQRTITRPGFAVTISNPDLPPPQPVLGPAGDSEQAGLEGSGEGDGGASEQPTNEDVAGTQLADLGSNNVPSNLAPTQTGGTTPPPANNQVEDAADPTTAQQNTTLDTAAGVSGGQRQVALSNNLAYSGRYLSQTPFTNFDFNTDFTTRVTSRNIFYSGATLQGGYASVSDGNITYQLPAKIGAFTFDSSNTNTPFGPVTGTGFGASDQSFFYWNLKEVNHSNNPASAFAGVGFTGSFPTSGVTAYSLTPGFPGDSSIPALPKATGGGITGALPHKFYVAWHTNQVTFPDDGRAVGLFGAIAVEGTGSSQKSATVTYFGTIFGDSFTSNKPTISGFSRGSVRINATSHPVRVGGGHGAASRDSFENTFFGITGPDHFVLGSDLTLSGTAQHQDAAAFVQNLTDPSVPQSTFFTESYGKTTSAGNVGSVRSARTLNGFVKGLGVVRFSSASIPLYIVENASDAPTSFQIQTVPTTNRLSAQASLQDAFASQSNLFVPFGGLTGNHRSRSAFIDDNVFAGRDSISSSPQVGGVTSTARIVLQSSAFFNTSSAVNAGTNFCNCSYTKWGFISGQVRGGTVFQRHVFHLVPWVAGELGTASVIASMTGTATFSGHVAANIMNGTSQYIDTGNYSQTWNFASRTGSVTISNLDGATYTGSLAEVMGSSGSRFLGTISGSSRTGEINGAFMKAGSDQAGEVGAGFHATNSSQQYYVAGIGIAKKN